MAREGLYFIIKQLFSQLVFCQLFLSFVSVTVISVPFYLPVFMALLFTTIANVFRCSFILYLLLTCASGSCTGSNACRNYVQSLKTHLYSAKRRMSQINQRHVGRRSAARRPSVIWWRLPAL